MPDGKSDEDVLASVLSMVEPPAAAPAAPAKPQAPPVQQARPASTPATWTLPGFYPKAKVVTSLGEMPIEALRRRDRVRTQKGTFLEVQWVDRIRVDEGFLEGNPDAHPILIRTSALGPKKPVTNMLISPAQMIVVGSEAYKSALDLTNRPGILRLPHSGFTYFRFHCGVACNVSVDGMWFRTEPH
jgi:hypothetical protein